MEPHKLPILKKNLELIIEALDMYKVTGLAKLDVEDAIKEQKKLWEELTKGGSDPEKWSEALLKFPETQYRAQMYKYNETTENLEILIAMLLVMKRECEGKSDEYLVENFIQRLS